jgi:hypothetical protein
MQEIEVTVRELLAQAERMAKLDAGRVDTVFGVGDRVLFTVAPANPRAARCCRLGDIGKLRPWREGPFTVTACPSPSAYTLALPRRMRSLRCSPTVNVDRLNGKPYVERATEWPPRGRRRTPARTAWTGGRD